MSQKIKRPNEFNYERNTPIVRTNTRKDRLFTKSHLSPIATKQVSNMEDDSAIMDLVKNNNKNQKPKKTNEKNSNLASLDDSNLKEEEQQDPANKNYLKSKLDKMEVPENIKKGIATGIQKTHGDVKEDFQNDKLDFDAKTHNNSVVNNNNNLNASMSSNVFLTIVNKNMSKENMRQLKSLKIEEEKLKQDIAKLEQSKSILEDEVPVKENIIDNNIRKTNLKSITAKKEELMSRLEIISKQIDGILNQENKTSKRDKIKQYLVGIAERQEEYSQKVAQYMITETKNREKFQKDKEISNQKRIKKLDQIDKMEEEKKQKLLKEIKDKDKKACQRRKKEMDEKMEKTKNYINEKIEKTEKDYLYYKNKDKFEKEEQKLIDKVNILKKESLMTQEEYLDFAKKLNEQKQILSEEEKEKKKLLVEMWDNRSQTLPKYKSPMLDIIEEEKNKKLEEELAKKKFLEVNIKEKENFSPPKVNASKKLKKIREQRIIKENKNTVLMTEKNNKDRIKNSYQVPVPKKMSNSNDKNLHSRNLLSENEYLDGNEVKSLLVKKPRKMLKPIQLLHPKPEKPYNYLEDLKRKRASSPNQKKKYIDDMDFSAKPTKKDVGTSNDNVIESISLAKIKISQLDNQLERKKKYLDINGGFGKNPELGDEVGDMLIQSIQAKLKIMNKMDGN